MKAFLRGARKILKNGLIWSVVMFAGVVYIMVTSVSDISSGVSGQQLDLIENAVRRSAVQCYALEGSYPEDLEYLVESYGLQYDTQRYVVHYRNVGGNFLPEISVFYLT